ncbi:MAG: hypothetical protein WD467_03765 [Candidatus Saccharimonadales bacterium]
MEQRSPDLGPEITAEDYSSAASYLYAAEYGVTERAEELRQAYSDLINIRRVKVPDDGGDTVKEEVLGLVDESYFETNLPENGPNLHHIVRRIYKNGEDVVELDEIVLSNGDKLEAVLYQLDKATVAAEIVGDSARDEATVMRLWRIRLMQRALDTLIHDMAAAKSEEGCA